MPKINTEECMACGQCEEVCPVGAIIVHSTHGYARFKIDELVCLECGECLNVDCPGDAIKE